jgi:glycosyltransferase involved in cell wall biosynthesis
MRKHKVSAFIPVQNVEDIIEECLDSVSWVDEIFVVDGFSTDRTVELCRRHPKVRLVQHAYENSGAQRAWGMPQVAHEWVFVIDSDERCTTELQAAIEQVLARDTIVEDAFRVAIRTEFLGRLLRHKAYLGYRGNRLVRRELHATFAPQRVHAGMRPRRWAWIPGRAWLVHKPIRSLESHWRKMFRYATWSAEDMRERGVRARWYHFTVRPALKFLHFYLLRGGFRDGLRGLTICVLGGITVSLKYLRLYELAEGRESRVESRESRVERRESRVERRESRVESRESRDERQGG